MTPSAKSNTFRRGHGLSGLAANISDVEGCVSTIRSGKLKTVHRRPRGGLAYGNNIGG